MKTATINKKTLIGRVFNHKICGAGGENRTLVTCLEGTYISHYTTPAYSN